MMSDVRFMGFKDNNPRFNYFDFDKSKFDRFTISEYNYNDYLSIDYDKRYGIKHLYFGQKVFLELNTLENNRRYNPVFRVPARIERF